MDDCTLTDAYGETEAACYRIRLDTEKGVSIDELTLDTLRTEIFNPSAEARLERIQIKVNMMLNNAIRERDKQTPGIIAYTHWNDIVTILTEIADTD